MIENHYLIMYSMLVIFMAKTNSPRRGLFLDMAVDHSLLLPINFFIKIT